MWWSSVASAQTFMPPVGTGIAGQVNNVYAFLLIASLISFVILVGGFVYFVVKYRRRSANDKTPYISHNHALEFLWSFIPFCLFIFVFAWGWRIFHQMRNAPENALEVHAFAKKWDWRFVYKNGREITSNLSAEGTKEPATMVVPVGRPVKLIMASEKVAVGSQDPTDRPVIHSFFVPAFRIKQDVVPGRFTTIWFQAEQEGDFWVFCTEYCGPGHSSMTAKVKVVSNPDFEKWLASGEAGQALSLADKGRSLYASKGCIGCHSVDGSPLVGPTLKGLWSKTEQTSAGAIKVDENYIRESVLKPAAVIVNGFPPAMPPYAGQLSDEDISAIVEFIKSVK